MIAMERLWSGQGKKYIIGTATALSVFVCLKYVLPVILPFFLALCAAVPLQKGLCRLERLVHIKRSVLAALFLVLLLGALGLGLWYAADLACGQIGALTRDIGGYRAGFYRMAHSCCERLERRIGIDGSGLERTIVLYAGELAADIERRALPGLMDRSAACIKKAGAAAAFFAVSVIAFALLIKDFDRIEADLMRFRWFLTAREIGGEIVKMTGHYLKAQGILLCVISAVCCTGLWSAGIEHGLLAGALAGALDALPFIGTGCVLLPLALWQLLQGKLWGCLWILALYAGCALVREFLEPKLLGESMGLYPVAILFSIYAGVRLYGIFGVILGPFSILLIREIYRKLLHFQEND